MKAITKDCKTEQRILENIPHLLFMLFNHWLLICSSQSTSSICQRFFYWLLYYSNFTLWLSFIMQLCCFSMIMIMMTKVMLYLLCIVEKMNDEDAKNLIQDGIKMWNAWRFCQVDWNRRLNELVLKLFLEL